MALVIDQKFSIYQNLPRWAQWAHIPIFLCTPRCANASASPACFMADRRIATPQPRPQHASPQQAQTYGGSHAPPILSARPPSPQHQPAKALIHVAIPGPPGPRRVLLLILLLPRLAGVVSGADVSKLAGATGFGVVKPSLSLLLSLSGPRISARLLLWRQRLSARPSPQWARQARLRCRLLLLVSLTEILLLEGILSRHTSASADQFDFLNPSSSCVLISFSHRHHYSSRCHLDVWKGQDHHHNNPGNTHSRHHEVHHRQQDYDQDNSCYVSTLISYTLGMTLTSI